MLWIFLCQSLEINEMKDCGEAPANTDSGREKKQFTWKDVALTDVITVLMDLF